MGVFVYNGKVDFSDTDAGGVVYFANFFRWVERAEGEWFRSLGVEFFERHEDGGYRGYPRVHVRCDYRAPLYPGDRFAIAITPEKVGRSSLTYGFRVHKGDVDGVLSAEGSVTVVCALGGHGGKGFKILELPEGLASLRKQGLRNLPHE